MAVEHGFKIYKENVVEDVTPFDRIPLTFIEYVPM